MAGKSVLPPHWEVPREFRGRLGEQAGRQRAMFGEGHLLLVLHQAPRKDEVQRKGRYFWRSPEGTWNATEFGSGPNALKRHLDEYAESIEKLDRQEERAVSAEDYFVILDELAPIHRAAGHLHQTLQEARKMCPGDRHLIIFRDRAYEILRTAELLYNETKNSLDFAMAKRAEEHAGHSYRMAISAHRLNLLAAFFFPIAALSALFGMNLTHGLETSPAPLPFVGVLLLGLFFGFVLISFVTRRGPGTSAAVLRDMAKSPPDSGR